MAERVFNGRRWKTFVGNPSTADNLLNRIEQAQTEGYQLEDVANLIVVGSKPEVAPTPTPTPTPTPVPDPTPVPTPTPTPTPSPVPLIFSGDFEGVPVGSSLTSLMSNWNDFGPSYHTPYNIAEIVSRNGSQKLQVNFLAGAGGNGPDFRIIKNLGQAYSNLYIYWEQEWSPQWVWAGADHKLTIVGAHEADQAVYFNVRGNGNGPVGRPVIYITHQDTMYSDPSVEIRGGVVTRFQLHVQNGQPVQAKVDEKLLVLAPEAGSGTSPIAANAGTGMLKLDTTYNAYSYIESVAGALPARTWYDNVKVSTQGWIA